jgi:hypothetical protein
LLEKTPLKKVIVTNRFGTTHEISDSDILNIKTSASVSEYCGTFQVTLKNDCCKNSKLVETKNEIKMWAGYEEEGIAKIMAGYVDRIFFQKKTESGEIAEIFGRSYESLLFDTKITIRVEYTEGLSQVVREVLKGSPFDLSGIKDSTGSGVVLVRNAPVIDIIRQISEENGWVFHIDYDKVVHFEPFSQPVKSHNIKSENIKSYEITKG